MLNKNMPEMPEVETVRRIIEPLIINKAIDHVDVFFDRLVISDLEDFKEKLKNQTILKVERYGKYLFFKLTNNLVLINHLRMEGKWRYENSGSKRNKYTTAMFYFKDDSSLAFDDTRKFGIMFLSTEKEYKNLEMISKLGIEPTKITTNDYQFIKEKMSSNKCLKDLLLDQTIFCGIGNIYADEIAFAAKLSPFTKGKDLTDNDIKNICENAKRIINEAIECGGSTIHSFHPSEGVDGKMQVNLKCYGHEGENCPNCTTLFHKTFIGGRGTTYCPNCQIDYSLKKAIGITGPIASGKSLVLDYLAKKDYLVISCDEEIHKLYREPAISSKISKILKIPFDIDNKNLTANAKKVMINFPSKKLEVENYIYPKLEEVLLKYIKENDKIAIEVPLLFKAHFEYMFKKIIVLSVTKEKQEKNLLNRNDNIETAHKINQDYSYNKDNKDVIVINNDGTIKELFNKIDKIIN